MDRLSKMGWLVGRDPGVRPLTEAVGTLPLTLALPAILPGPPPTVAGLQQVGATAVLCVAAESSSKKVAKRAGCDYAKVAFDDSPDAVPPVAAFLDCWRYAQDANAACVRNAVALRLVVNCRSGRHRSPAVAAFLLAAFAGIGLDLAWNLLVGRYAAAEKVPAYMTGATAALATLQAAGAADGGGDGDDDGGRGTGRPTRAPRAGG